MIKTAISYCSDILNDVIGLSKKAGKNILDIYDHKDFGTVLKDDLSPLTLADTASHNVIINGLKKLLPNIPVLSEESQSIPYEIRKEWKEYWLVDPLDGTKEFIKRNGEFTVNIALIKNNEPVLGVVYAPVLDVGYFAEKGKGSFKENRDGVINKIAVQRDFSNGLKIVASRSHEGKEEGAFFKKLGAHEYVRMGSSLKFCLVAEGQAHLYPRFLPTREWDTAAAQCVAMEAGAEVTDLSGKPLQYNKKDLLNPYFIVSSVPQEFWKKALLLFFAVTSFLGTSACHAKSMDVVVTGSVKTAYNDNITYVDKGRLEGFITNLETGLELMQQGRRHELTLKADVIEQIYANHSSFDNTAEDLNFTLKEKLTEHDRLALVDILTNSYEPTSFEDAFGRTDGRYNTFNNQTGISYTHDFTERLSGEAHFGDTLNYYSHNGPVNSILYQAGATVKYARDSATIFSVAYDYLRRLFMPGPSARINSVVAGIRRYLTSQLYIDLGAGPDFISNFNGRNNIKPHYTAALTDNVNENTNLSLTFEKQDTTNVYTEDLFDSWRTALNLYRKLSPRLDSYTGVFYGQGRYNNLNIHENFVGVQTGLNYNLSKKTKLGAGYSYTNSLSNSINHGYRKNYVYFSVTITF